MKNLSAYRWLLRPLTTRLVPALAGLALLATAAPALAQTPTFAPVVNTSTGPNGSQPYSVAVADVNGDGKPDALLANNNTSTLAVLLGDGAGGFTLQAASPSTGANSYPRSVAVADVNGDGKPDALLANTGSSTLAVLLGDGAGGFTLQAASPSTGANGYPFSVAVADVNGDGKPDALLANYGSSTLAVLLGDGAGGFTLQAASPSTGANGSGPRSVAVADVNGDGKPDALLANYGSSTLAVLLGDGAGGFTLQAASPSTGINSNPYSVAVADVNGDGKPDALLTNSDSNTLSVLLGDGAGGFTLQAASPSTGANGYPFSVAVADVNGDGKPDALLANYGSSTLAVLLGDGAGGFTLQAASPSTGINSVPFSVAVADVNGDGKPDALLANYNSSTLGVLLNTTVYTAPILTSLSPVSGPVGTHVTLTGTNFTGATGVRFNGTAATTFAVVNATTATATVPPGTTTGSVTITTPLGTSNGVVFTLCAPQAIAQAATVLLGANGTVSLAAATVNNGSTANCGFATGGGLSVTPSSFTCANLGDNRVTLTVTDAGGNTATATTHVLVVDLLPPSITAPAAVTRRTDANQCTAAAGSWLGTATATDNCAAVVTSNAPAVFPKGLTTVTWTATDAFGNVAIASQTVTVVDGQNPAFATQPGTRNVSTDAGLCSAGLTLVLPTASDNCSGTTVAGVRSDNQPLTDPFAKGTTSITWTATDGAGNTATYNQSIVVTDHEAPVARTQPVTVTLSSLGTATLTATQVDNGSSDNCGSISLSLDKTSFSCANLGPNTVTLTVKDVQGNANSATATVTVVGSIPAAAITVGPASTVYTGGVATNLYLGYGPQSVTLQASAGGTSYAWTGPAGLSSTTSAAPVFTATTAGSFAYQVTITNQSGCTNTAAVTLTVQDVRCGSNNNKVLVCHHGSQICISADAVAAHLLNHHDPLGKCTAGTARVLAASPGAAQPPLFEAFPNPFTESTTLRFRAMATGTAQLRVYNALGQLVLTLYDQETQADQVHEVVLAGKDLAEGLYTCRLQLNNRLFTQRVMLSR